MAEIPCRIGVARPAGAPSAPDYVVETTSTNITVPPTTGAATNALPEFTISSDGSRNAQWVPTGSFVP